MLGDVMSGSQAGPRQVFDAHLHMVDPDAETGDPAPVVIGGERRRQ